MCPAVWQTPEEGQRINQPKRCEYNYKDEDNSLKIQNDKKSTSFVEKIQTTRIYIAFFYLSSKNEKSFYQNWY